MCHYAQFTCCWDPNQNHMLYNHSLNWTVSLTTLFECWKLLFIKLFCVCLWDMWRSKDNWVVFWLLPSRSWRWNLDYQVDSRCLYSLRLLSNPYVKLKKFRLICLCIHLFMYASARVSRGSENNPWVSVLFSHHVGPGTELRPTVWTQVHSLSRSILFFYLLFFCMSTC